MDVQHEEPHETKPNKEMKSFQVSQQATHNVNERQGIIHEDKFTWEVGDLIHFIRAKDIPGYTSFSGTEKRRRKFPAPIV